MSRLVCVIGTDGSGKTTLSAELVKRLHEGGVHARHEWLGAESYLMGPVRAVLKLLWRGRQGSRRALQEPVEGQSADGYRAEIARKNSLVNRFTWGIRAYVFLILLDYRLQYRRKMRRLRGSQLIVADRYVFDVVINLGLTLGWDTAQTVRFLQTQMTVFRLPDVRVFLRVEPEVSLARKDDIPDIDYLRLRLAYYDAVAAAFGFEVRDGALPFEQTSAWMAEFVKAQLRKPHVHYVHANNLDVGGADKVLVRMAEHMGSRGRVDAYRTSVSLRLPTDSVGLHEAAGTPVLLRDFQRPQMSNGLTGVVRFLLLGPHTYWYFRRLFKLQQPDLVHVNDVYDFLPALAASRSSIPVVHHLRMFQSNSIVRRGLAGLVSRFAVASVSVSEAVRSHYFPGPVTGHTPVTIHDLGDASLLAEQGDVCRAAERPEGLPAEGLLVTMVGRVEEWKGQSLFLDAVARLDDATRARASFVLVGGPVPGKEAYFEEVERRAVDLDVAMLGPRCDVPAILRASDISVHCSTAPDPFPGVVVESLLAGAATVGSDAGGVPEMIASPDVGTLVAPTDAQALAEVLSELIAGPAKPRERYALAARARGLALVDPDPIDRQLSDLYASVLEQRGSAS